MRPACDMGYGHLSAGLLVNWRPPAFGPLAVGGERADRCKTVSESNDCPAHALCRSARDGIHLRQACRENNRLEPISAKIRCGSGTSPDPGMFTCRVGPVGSLTLMAGSVIVPAQTAPVVHAAVSGERRRTSVDGQRAARNLRPEAACPRHASERRHASEMGRRREAAAPWFSFSEGDERFAPMALVLVVRSTASFPSTVFGRFTGGCPRTSRQISLPLP